MTKLPISIHRTAQHTATQELYNHNKSQMANPNTTSLIKQHTTLKQ